MVEVLDLSQDTLANPQRTDLIDVEVLMLWPDDRDMQTEGVRTALVAAGLERPKLLNRDELLALAKQAADATRLSQIHDQVARHGGPFVKGLVASEILFFALQRTATNAAVRDRAMKRIMEDVANGFASIWPISAKTIETHVWPFYRRVAHFWVAFRWLKEDHGCEYPFPCAVSDLSLFLGIAEAFRQRGEATKVHPQAPGTVLTPGECIQASSELVVPRFELEFSAKSTA